jgi:AcrR family transcriptional regulator
MSRTGRSAYDQQSMTSAAPSSPASKPESSSTGSAAPKSASGPYHHGNLHEALLDAVGEIIAEKGVGGLSLREAARRAGVSHGAPAHHFGDKLGMLTAYSTRGMELFGQRMRAAAAEADTPNDKIAAIGLAYLTFAMDEPDYFNVMFRSEMQRADDEQFHTASSSCFDVLSQIAEELNEANGAESAATDRPDPMPIGPKGGADAKAIAIRAWSMVHGLATLWLDGAIAHIWDGDDVYELALRVFEIEP